MTVGFVDFNVTAQNTGTSNLKSNLKDINVTVDVGNFIGTITLQRRYLASGVVASPTPFSDIETYSTASLDINKRILSDAESGVEYRLFVKTGDFTSGSAYLRLSY